MSKARLAACFCKARDDEKRIINVLCLFYDDDKKCALLFCDDE